MIIDEQTTKPNDAVSKKRKRSTTVIFTCGEEKEAKINALREEMESLYRFYGEMLEKVGDFEEYMANGVSLDSAIALLMEEKQLPLSKLVGVISEKLKGSFGINAAGVKSKVILIGQRLCYGLVNVDADVLEDESQSALWCWEARDVKLMPKSTRNMLKIRRTCRRKIHERIMALSSMIDALHKSENHQDTRHELVKASEKLRKILNEADIRLLVESMGQKNDAEMAEKETKREEKVLIKQLEKNKREVEKEKKRMDRELQKEKLQSERELKRLQDEAEKEERRREKEELELKKQLQRQQEEAEKDQRRKEKEEAELKRQLKLQKQASLMERFLKGTKPSLASQGDHSSRKATLSDSSTDKRENRHGSVTQSMDFVFSQTEQTDAEDLWNSHLNSWRRLGSSTRARRKMHWGIRQNPKTEVFRGLKLSTNKEATPECDSSVEKLVDGWVDPDSRLCDINTAKSSPNGQKYRRCKQLLQFDKSCRPAFYGIWPGKSQAVGARHPFSKDPDLDYEIDSDEEWEEEEPGESLSDCDKDDEAENLEEGFSKDEDEDESEDGFFVPDGYLSDNEGVEVDKMESDHFAEEARSLPSSTHVPLNDEFSVLLRQQKYLNNLTEHALRKNQPLIILNLMHEKAPLLLAEDLAGAEKVEKMCLQALSMYTFPSCPSIEISVCHNGKEEDQEACSSNSKASTTPVATGAANLDTDLPQIITVIQSCSHGINKLVEALQRKFPNSPKSQLRNKVREIADYSDNRWQVKKDILVKFGLPISPEVSGRTKSIVTFFTKRCLPPSGKTINPIESSPQSSQEPVVAIQQQQGFPCEHK